MLLNVRLACRMAHFCHSDVAHIVLASQQIMHGHASVLKLLSRVDALVLAGTNTHVISRSLTSLFHKAARREVYRLKHVAMLGGSERSITDSKVLLVTLFIWCLLRKNGRVTSVLLLMGL